MGGCQVRPLTHWRLLVENLGAVGRFTCSVTSWFVVTLLGPHSALDTDRVVTRLPRLLRVREGAVEVYVCWDPGRACAVRLRYVSVKDVCCWLILVPGPCARGRMCCEACTRALRDNFAMHAPSQVVGITEHLRRHHGLMVSTGKGASAVIPCLSFPSRAAPPPQPPPPA